MESDMYNLVPAIGEINGLRSNFRFRMIAGENRKFGPCDMEIQKETRTAEPPERVRGDIARTYQYMAWAYGQGIIGKTNKKLFEAWSKQDPVDKWECERARIIQGIQGNENKVVKKACIQAGLWNSTSGVDPSVSLPKEDKTSSGDFTCGKKRYCKQMTSCEEAEFYLNECGLTRLDRDNDGVPCEALCK